MIAIGNAVEIHEKLRFHLIFMSRGKALRAVKSHLLQIKENEADFRLSSKNIDDDTAEEYFWTIGANYDWYYRTSIELRIMEVQVEGKPRPMSGTDFSNGCRKKLEVGSRLYPGINAILNA